jgi:hypothetical protein
MDEKVTMASRERAKASISTAPPESSAIPVNPAAAPGARAAQPSSERRVREAPSAAAASQIGDPRVDCLMNARYHASREAFLDTVHRWFMFAVIALGATATIDLAPQNWGHIASGLSATMAGLIAALDLTFDLSNRARSHALMKRRYFELLADFAEGRKSTEEVHGCMNRFAADEEPAWGRTRWDRRGWQPGSGLPLQPATPQPS